MTKTTAAFLEISREDTFVILCHVGAALFAALFLTLTGLVLRYAI